MASSKEVSKGLTPLVISILHSNLGANYTEEDKVRMVKSMRLCLRLDYEMKATDVRKLNDYEVIEKWYEFHLEERIGGA
jgi:hypothetical protein